MKYLIKSKEQFTGTTQSILLDDNTVAYTEHPDTGQRLTLTQYLKTINTPLTVVTSDELDLLLENYYKSLITEWQEIDEDHYLELLNCMPPLKWKKFDEGEYFFLCEAYTSNLHYNYCIYQNRFFKRLALIIETHQNIVSSINRIN